MVYLNEPNKEIEHEEGSNDYLAYSVGQMQGWRLNMVSFYHIHLHFSKRYKIIEPGKFGALSEMDQ